VSVSASVHVEAETEVIGRLHDEDPKMRWTSLMVETLGVGGVTIFFSEGRDPNVKMSAVIQECIDKLTTQLHQHLAWEGDK